MIRPFARILRMGTAPLLLALAAMLIACGDDAADEPHATSEGSPTATEAAGGTTGTEANSTAEAPSSSPESDEDPFADVPGIVDPTNRGWPREVEGLNGRISIEAKPQRIHTTSVGFDEITLGLVPASRLAAVGTSSQNTDHSNIAALVADVPGIGRDPEQIASVGADLVVASPNRDADFIGALEAVEIPVVQLELREGAEGRIQTILLFGYLYGEEERALELAAEVQARHDALLAITSTRAAEDRPSVMYTTKYAENMTTSASGSTAESITLAAGGTCAPCDAGLSDYPRISLETLIELDPDVIVLGMTPAEGEAYREELLSTPALAEVTAVRNGQVHLVPARFHTTLSYENIRGAEQLATILWPDDFPADYRDGPPPFSLPGTDQ